MTNHLRILEPCPGILAFYDGRVPGYRAFADANWVDDGAISLGIASYAILSGDEALVYDTHVSVAHANAIRAELSARGIRRFTVVLSHWHLDHVAGSEAFADVPILANSRTLEHLRANKPGIEDATFHGLPAISPLILPNRTFEDRIELVIGSRRVELIAANIHSDDATVLWLPQERVLLAGDTVEDCVTYVGEPADFDRHLTDLVRLMALNPARVLPNHGDAETIARGGYSADLLAATADYITWLQGLDADPSQIEMPLAEVISKGLANGSLHYFQPYETVHRQNIARTQALHASRHA